MSADTSCGREGEREWKKCKISELKWITEVCTQLCKTSSAIIHLTGMLCVCACAPLCFHLVSQARIFPFCCTNIYVYRNTMTCRSVPTGRTGHSVNTAPLCSQPVKVKLLEGASRNDRNDFETLEFAVSLFIGWSLKFLQYLRLHFCLSDYHRFKTMAILSDNNRWKCSCWEVCAQSNYRWATWENWEWRKLREMEACPAL